MADGQIRLDCRPERGSSRHRAPVLREGWKSANIHVGSEFIWGIPVMTNSNLAGVVSENPMGKRLLTEP